MASIPLSRTTAVATAWAQESASITSQATGVTPSRSPIRSARRAIPTTSAPAFAEAEAMAAPIPLDAPTTRSRMGLPAWFTSPAPIDAPSFENDTFLFRTLTSGDLSDFRLGRIVPARAIARLLSMTTPKLRVPLAHRNAPMLPLRSVEDGERLRFMEDGCP
jgi:hypothetical protein